MLEIEVATPIDRRSPAVCRSGKIIGVDHILQALRIQSLSCGHPGVVQPLPAQVVAAPVRQACPHQLWYRLRQRMEPLLAFAQCRLGRLTGASALLELVGTGAQRVGNLVNLPHSDG